MSQFMDDLALLVSRVDTAVANPWDLRRLGWRLLEEAKRRDGGRVSRAEVGADRLSTDGVRNPDLTYGDPQ